jgi:excisionase family DNA binding protein
MELMKTREVANLLRLTTARVSQLCAEGKLKAYRTHGDSGHWRVDRNSVLAQVKLPEPVMPEKDGLTEADTSIFKRIKQQVRGNS